MFKCNWVDVHKKNGMKIDEIGFIMMNMMKCLNKARVQYDPFILASHAKQVLYVQDIIENEIVG